MIRGMITVFVLICLSSVSLAQEKDIIFKGKGVVVTKEDFEYKKNHLPPGFTTTDEEIRKVVLMNRLFSLEAEKKWGKDPDFNTELEKSIEMFMAAKYRKYIIDQIDVSDKVLKSYFLANQDQFAVPAMYNFKIIVTFSSHVAESIVEDIKNSVDSFENYAKKMSLDASTAEKGGDVGWVEKSKLPPIFAEKLSLCRKGEIAEPFNFRGQWIIFHLLDKKDSQPIQFDERVKKSIREKLLNRKVAKIVQENFEKLLKEYSISPQ